VLDIRSSVLFVPVRGKEKPCRDPDRAFLERGKNMKKIGVKILTCFLCMLALATVIVVPSFADAASGDFWTNGVKLQNAGYQAFADSVKADAELSGSVEKVYVLNLAGVGNEPGNAAMSNWYATYSADWVPVAYGAIQVDYQDDTGALVYTRQLLGEIQIRAQQSNYLVYRVLENGAQLFNIMWMSSGSVSVDTMDSDAPAFRSNLTVSVYIAHAPSCATESKWYCNPIGMEEYSLADYTAGYNGGYTVGQNAGYNSGYNDGYEIGESDGWDFGYDDGHSEGYQAGLDYCESNNHSSLEGVGYEKGYSAGVTAGKEYCANNNHEQIEDTGYQSGYNDGYSEGYGVGYSSGETGALNEKETFKEMVFAIFDAPARLIDGMLDFDLLGINVAGFVKTILTLAVVAAIVVVLVKFIL